MDPIDRTFLMADVAAMPEPTEPYVNPWHVVDGPNNLINLANQLNTATREASVEEIIEAARFIQGAGTAAIGMVSKLYVIVNAQALDGRHLVRRGVDDAVSLENEPDDDFKAWCLATEAYLTLSGRANGRFRGSPGHRQNFARRYERGLSGIQAYDELYDYLTSRSMAHKRR